MAITHVDTNFARVTVNGDITVTAPTGIADDDLLMAYYLHTDNDAEPVSCTGFTTIEAGVEDGLGGIDSTTAFFRKIASSEAGNYTMSGDSPPTPLTSNGVVGCFRGVDTTTPMDVTYVQGDHYSKHDNAASVTNDPIATVTDGAWVLLYIWIGQGNVTDFTAPSGYTIAVKNAGQTSSNVALAYKEVATAGTETPGPWTATGISTTEEVVTVTLAIRPASTTSIAAIMRHRQMLGMS